MRTDKQLIAFFSMEIALDPAMPTYSGGLGVLAGDTLRAAAQLEAGKLVFELNGQKLHGRFHLVKTHSGKGDQWLLIKGKDRWASNKDVLQQDRSVLSGKRIEELACMPHPPRRKRFVRHAG